jgi:hypothetical protein
MIRKLLLGSAFMLFTLVLFSYIYYSKAYKPVTGNTAVLLDKAERNKLLERSETLQAYAREHGYNTKIAFMIDMKIESGRERFYVLDMNKDSVLMKGLVTHGCCNENWLSGRRYGNEVGCGCTSLGRYKIGKSYQGKFGLAYKLYGLDSSNSNAYKRFVVLHSHACVPAREVHPYPICQSNGCPTVSPSFLCRLKPIIDKSDHPILLYIYE